MQQLRGANINYFIGLKKGDKVLHGQNTPRLLWKIFRVTTSFIERDGKVRICDVIISNRTILRRPLQPQYSVEIIPSGEGVKSCRNPEMQVFNDSTTPQRNKRVDLLP